MRRTVSLILMAMMLVTLFASCAETGDSTTADVTTAAETVTEAVETEIQYLDMLESVNYDGASYTILGRDSFADECWVESENGEVINDAVFRRNKAVEEKYHVTIGTVLTADGWNDQGVFMDAVRRSVQGQDNAYHLISGYLAYTATLAMEGMFYNIYEIDTVDLTNPWWASGYVNNNTFNDRMYMTVGDISLSMWKTLTCLYFNKQLAANYEIPDLYRIVRDGDWTLEQMENIAKGVSEDLDGDSAYTTEDLYGFATTNFNVRAFVTSSDIPIASRNDEGSFDFVYYSDRLVSLYDRMYDMFNGGNAIRLDESAAAMFEDGHALLVTGNLGGTQGLREMDTDFGIIPYPKFDDSQENYITHAGDILSVFAIPASATEPEFCGIIMEAMGAESKSTVIPAFYEISLKGKVTRDNESEEMIDIIRDTVLFDFGFVHSVPMGGIYQVFGDQLVAGTERISSVYEKKAKSYDSSFKKVIKAYEKVA